MNKTVSVKSSRYLIEFELQRLEITLNKKCEFYYIIERGTWHQNYNNLKGYLKHESRKKF